MNWVCTKCGQCCRHVGEVPSMAQYAKEDGSCKFLTEDNLCAIYSDRPPICRVDWVFENFFKATVSEDEFYEKTLEACKQLQGTGDIMKDL